MFAQESVMDIKKLKAEFEKLKYVEEKLEYLNFDEHLGCYVEKNNGMPVGLAAWVNGAFYGFEQAAKAQAVPEWISVEDKLPTENGNYLVCIDGDVFYLTAKWVKNHFKFLARGYGLTEDFTDWRYCEGVKVTHWMTLPAAPQEPTND